MPRTLIGIIGGHSQNTTPQALQLAQCVGAEIGRRGLGVICGAEGGIMEAACLGCKQSGGTTIGILKGNRISANHSYLDFAIVTSMDIASNNIIVWSSAGLIALDGRFGTLNEIALALDFGKPLVSLGTHRHLKVENVDVEHFVHYEGYDSACVPAILDRLESMIKGTTL